MTEIVVKSIDATRWSAEDGRVKIKLATTENTELVLQLPHDQLYKLISLVTFANWRAEKALALGEPTKFPLRDADVAVPADNPTSDERLLLIQFDHGGYLR